MKKPLSLRDLDIKGKRVLMRVDFNVPLTKEGQLADDTRLRAALPSIRYICQSGASLILMSHLGRPKGQKQAHLSLKSCAQKLQELLGAPVLMADDCLGPKVSAQAQALAPQQVLLLENLRFYSAEEHPENDLSFAQQLASLGDCYVNDAFGTAHRAHSSTALICRYFPGKCAAGFLLEQEVSFLSNLLEKPQRPFYALIGGAKISTKIGVLNALFDKVDALLIGGAMAYTFLKEEGMLIGDSLCEDDSLESARALLTRAQHFPGKLQLPLDFVVADSISPTAKKQVVAAVKGIPDGLQGVDIGPKTIKAYEDILQGAKTIFWNGPVGVFECPPFDFGTNALAQAIAQHERAVTVVGGGDSIAAVQKAGLVDKFSYISTGGGASLEFIEKGSLPGLDALIEAQRATAIR